MSVLQSEKVVAKDPENAHRARSSSSTIATVRYTGVGRVELVGVSGDRHGDVIIYQDFPSRHSVDQRHETVRYIVYRRNDVISCQKFPDGSPFDQHKNLPVIDKSISRSRQ